MLQSTYVQVHAPPALELQRRRGRRTTMLLVPTPGPCRAARLLLIVLVLEKEVEGSVLCAEDGCRVHGRALRPGSDSG
eukprot:COSAG06_NODE_23749_length_682_cov_6.600343_2_plen_78_part_00